MQTSTNDNTATPTGTALVVLEGETVNDHSEATGTIDTLTATQEEASTGDEECGASGEVPEDTAGSETNASDLDSGDQTEATVSKTETLFGIDVSDVGTEYPTSGHRVATSIRAAVKHLDQLLYSLTDGDVEIVARNLKAGLNRLEKRVATGRRCTAIKAAREAEAK